MKYFKDILSKLAGQQREKSMPPQIGTGEQKYVIHYDGEPVTEPKTYKQITQDHGKVRDLERDPKLRIIPHVPKSTPTPPPLPKKTRAMGKNQDIKIPKKEFVKEHKRLINVLETPSHKDDIQEAKKQRKELKEQISKSEMEISIYDNGDVDLVAGPSVPKSVFNFVFESLQKKKKSFQFKAKHKSKKGGLTEAGRKAYNKATGSNLKRPQPEGGKRKKSFCARSKGQMKMHNIDCSKTPDKRVCLARRRWACKSEGNLYFESLAKAVIRGPWGGGPEKPGTVLYDEKQMPKQSSKIESTPKNHLKAALHHATWWAGHQGEYDRILYYTDWNKGNLKWDQYKNGYVDGEGNLLDKDQLKTATAANLKHAIKQYGIGHINKADDHMKKAIAHLKMGGFLDEKVNINWNDPELRDVASDLNSKNLLSTITDAGFGADIDPYMVGGKRHSSFGPKGKHSHKDTKDDYIASYAHESDKGDHPLDVLLTEPDVSAKKSEQYYRNLVKSELAKGKLCPEGKAHAKQWSKKHGKRYPSAVANLQGAKKCRNIGKPVGPAKD